jgi:hypothetical protein
VGGIATRGLPFAAEIFSLALKNQRPISNSKNTSPVVNSIRTQLSNFARPSERLLPRPLYSRFGKAMLLSSGGGAVAIWASSGLSAPDGQAPMDLAVIAYNVPFEESRIAARRFPAAATGPGQMHSRTSGKGFCHAHRTVLRGPLPVRARACPSGQVGPRG